MKKEVQVWLDQAYEDLDDAEYNFKGERYKTTSFLCQQAVEKSCKALLLQKTGKLRKIHDLVELGKSIDLPSRLLDNCKELTLAYIYSRYPDVVPVDNLEEKSAHFLEIARGVLQWIEKKI